MEANMLTLSDIAKQGSGYTNSIGSRALNTAMQRLSSGLRINSASDDASGMAVAMRLNAQIGGLGVAGRNIQDSTSMLQTAEGGLSHIGEALSRMRELAVQSANGIYTSSDRSELNKEFTQLRSEIDRITGTTEFNTHKLLNGSTRGNWSSNNSGISVDVDNSSFNPGSYRVSISQGSGGAKQVSTSGFFSTIGDTTTTTGIQSGVQSVRTTGLSQPNSQVAYSVKVVASAIATKVSGAGTYRAAASTWSQQKITAGATNRGNFTGYAVMDFGGATSTGGQTATYHLYDATTGQEVSTGTVKAAVHDTKPSAVVTASSAKFTVTDAKTGVSFDYSMQNTAGALKVNSGDKALVTIQAAGAAKTLANGRANVVFTSSAQGTQGAVSIALTPTDRLSLKDNDDADHEANPLTAYVMRLDTSNGAVNKGSITVNFGETKTGALAAQTISTKVGSSGGAAQTSTRLNEMSQFQITGGGNIFDSGTHDMTFVSNAGRKATVTLAGSDTVNDVDNKITDALISIGVGSSSISSDRTDLVKFTNGQFQVSSGKVGTNNGFSIVGDDALDNTFAFTTTQQAASQDRTITIANQDTGRVMYSGVTSSDSVTVDGNKVHIDEGVQAGNYNFMVSKSSGQAGLSQVGANEGQQLDVSIGSFDSKSLGINGLNLFTQGASSSSISAIDSAISKVASSRSTIGAQQNRLDYTFDNVQSQRKNLISSLGRIQDADIAEEMSKFTSELVKQQLQLGVQQMLKGSQSGMLQSLLGGSSI